MMMTRRSGDFLAPIDAGPLITRLPLARWPERNQLEIRRAGTERSNVNETMASVAT